MGILTGNTTFGKVASADNTFYLLYISLFCSFYRIVSCLIDEEATPTAKLYFICKTELLNVWRHFLKNQSTAQKQTTTINYLGNGVKVIVGFL